MNCAEFQRVLPEVIEGGRTAEQQAHLASCRACSGIVSDLNAISEAALQLRASEQPSPRVWNSLEIALRREGLIRPPQGEAAVTRPFWGRWNLGWMVPVAALALVVGVTFYEHGSRQPEIAQQIAPAPLVMSSQVAKPDLPNADDQQLLEAVGSRSPATRAEYLANLQHVNDYIRDAEQSAQADPNDEEAQQSVMDAYEQRAMVYNMALDRSLP